MESVNSPKDLSESNPGPLGWKPVL